MFYLEQSISNINPSPNHHKETDIFPHTASLFALKMVGGGVSMCSFPGEFLERPASDEGQGRVGNCVGPGFKLVCVLKLKIRAPPSRRGRTPSAEFSATSLLGSTADFETEPC